MGQAPASSRFACPILLVSRSLQSQIMVMVGGEEITEKPLAMLKLPMRLNAHTLCCRKAAASIDIAFSMRLLFVR